MEGFRSPFCGIINPLEIYLNPCNRIINSRIENTLRKFLKCKKHFFKPLQSPVESKSYYELPWLNLKSFTIILIFWSVRRILNEWIFKRNLVKDMIIFKQIKKTDQVLLNWRFFRRTLKKTDRVHMQTI